MKKIIKSLLNENNNDNIILVYENVNVEFEQVALILVRDNYYSILRPVTVMDGIDNDEGLVFLVDTNDNKLILIEEEDVIDEVYDVYFSLLDEKNL